MTENLLDRRRFLVLPANPHVKFYNGSYRGYVYCDVTPERWESTLRIVLDPRDASSSAYTIATYEVRDGVPGPQRLDDGDGLTGTVADADGQPLHNAESLVRGDDGAGGSPPWTAAAILTRGPRCPTYRSTWLRLAHASALDDP